MSSPSPLSDVDVALFELLTDFGDLKCHTPDLEREVSVRARRLLDEGANPNALNAKGVSPLGMVGRAFIRTSEHVGKVIEALIKKGADPMKQDKAFVRFCKSTKEWVREEFVLGTINEMCKMMKAARLPSG